MPEPRMPSRLANVEYDPRYEPLVAVVCAAVAVASVVALAVFSPETWLVRPLVTLGLVGTLGALGAIGAYALRS